MTLNTQLQQGLADLKLDLPTSAEVKLLKYISLLEKWNKAFNLTAITDPYEIITHHLLDSLSVVSFITGGRICDVGTGAGLPGIPLSIALPEKKFSLLDSNGKKTRFLVQAISELKVNNVEVVQSRVENFQPKELFNNITARAFGSVHDIIRSCQHLLKPDGQMLLMRGQIDQQELVGIKGKTEVVALDVPRLRKERNLLVVEVG